VNLDCSDVASLTSDLSEARGDEPAPTKPTTGDGRTFLIISAPFGPFARELAVALRGRGARVLRVILNGGDALDWGAGDAVFYAGGLSSWRRWLERQVVGRDVTDIVTYGDSSPYAALALHVAQSQGLRAQVLEQGYFRPDWVTVERGGVNANSRLPVDPDWYRNRCADPCAEPSRVGRTTPSAIAHIIAYHLAVYAAAAWFPQHKAHYSEPAYRQAIGHVARFCWQQMARGRHRRAFEGLVANGAPLFLCLLQRPGDSQLVRHSDFMSTADYVERVVSSFAAHAPPEARLIVRPHPLDPGLTRYPVLLEKAARRGGADGRVAYVDYGKLHEVLPHVRGVVCVNSTAGLAAVEFGKPTITLGRAIYDMPGMTHQGGLDRFWTAPETPDGGLYAAFRRAVLAETQVNGAYATARGRRLAVSGVAERLLAAPAICAGFSAPPERRRAPMRSGPPIAVPDMAAVGSD
jgi:capsular polysaccharide export protein